MKFLILSIFIITMMFGLTVEQKNWPKNRTFIQFLEDNYLPTDLYYEQDSELQKLTEEIYAGMRYHTAWDYEDLVQLLIPVNEELQLHIYKQHSRYFIETIPIEYQVKREALVTTIKLSPYQSIMDITKDTRLASAFVQTYKNSINFRSAIKKGDRLVIVYDQKYRLGQKFGFPQVVATMLETNKKKNYVFLHDDGNYYNSKGNEVEGFFLAKPVRHARISSRFTYRRFHPILKRYRAHLGVDYAARRGTPIMAAASGRIIYAGWLGGYGKVTKIQHRDGYMTLYAHQKSFRKGMRRGKRVKKGQVIGYVGSTGRSTGPHLHFGLYKNKRAINPARSIRISTKRLKGQNLEAFNEIKKEMMGEIDYHLNAGTQPNKVESFRSFSEVKKGLL
jgi:murein DD-endopeptidase MepM/ murein hydrolase activator NlpD